MPCLTSIAILNGDQSIYVWQIIACILIRVFSRNYLFLQILGQIYREGEKVYAKWKDCKSYPAQVNKRFEDGQFYYYDGRNQRILKN